MDSSEKVDCCKHGLMDYALVCQHLVNQSTDHHPIEYFDAGYENELGRSEVENFWCKPCDDMLLSQGDWNEVAAAFAAPKVVCVACLQEIKARNINGKL